MTKSNTNIPILDEVAIAEIEVRANAATEGPWESDNAQDSEHHYQYYMAIDPASRVLFDTFNSALGEIHEEADEDGVYRWDEIARRNIAFVSHARADIPALCHTVRVLRAENSTLKGHWADTSEDLASALLRREELQSQLEQLRAENERQRSALIEHV